jgi:ABC-type antimicrobial peptide transport system permease subunit
VNARGYSIIGLISIICLGLATEVRRGYALRWAPVLMGALAAVAFWTIPVFAFAWAGVLLWMVAPASEVRLPVRVRFAVLAGVISVAGAALLYWPVLRQVNLPGFLGGSRI